MKPLNAIDLPDIDDNDIDNLKLVGPIEFLSDEQNKQILEDLKCRLKNEKYMKWYSLEEMDKKMKEQFGFWKKYTVIISEAALDDIHNILDYCKFNYSLSYAKKIHSLLIQNIYSISIFPNSNPLHSVSNNTILRKGIVQRRYIIVFKVVFNNVIITELYDGRRNISNSDLELHRSN